MVTRILVPCIVCLVKEETVTAQRGETIRCTGARAGPCGFLKSTSFAAAR